MANKLAGQRAKFSRARAIFYSSSDEGQRNRAAQLMAEVLADAPANGFTEDEVTQGEDVPDDVRQLSARMPARTRGFEDDPDALVAELQSTVDTVDVREIGQGDEFVYAYGYRCAPDRLKIGKCAGDVVARIAAEIGTGTPDKPVLLLRIPVPSEQIGDPLAAAFETALGPLASRFLETMERGSTGTDELEAFRAVTPSGIGSDTEERELYENLLFAGSDLQRAPDLDRSLLLILQLAQQIKRMPSVRDIRWALYAGHDESGRPRGPWNEALEKQRRRWWVYQANDLTHLAYETLLKFTLDVLESHPSGITLPALIDTCVPAIAEAADAWPESWTGLIDGIVVPDSALQQTDPHAEFALAETIMKGARHDATCEPETAWLALKLLIAMTSMLSRPRSNSRDVASCRRS